MPLFKEKLGILPQRYRWPKFSMWWGHSNQRKASIECPHRSLPHSRVPHSLSGFYAATHFKLYESTFQHITKYQNRSTKRSSIRPDNLVLQETDMPSYLQWTFHHFIKSCNSKQQKIISELTRPTKKRTEAAPDFTGAYCIHVLRTAILCLKLFAVEKTPMKRSNCLWRESGADLSSSRLTMCSESSDVGKPLARTEINCKSPDILTSLTSHGSKVWTENKESRKWIQWYKRLSLKF